MDYLNSLSPEYIESLKKSYEKDPSTVPKSWRFFFDGLTLGENNLGKGHLKQDLKQKESHILKKAVSSHISDLSNSSDSSNLIHSSHSPQSTFSNHKSHLRDVPKLEVLQGSDFKKTSKTKSLKEGELIGIELRILDLIEAYRQRGHLLADLDPLGLKPKLSAKEVQLDLASFGLEDVDPQMIHEASSHLGLAPMTLSQIQSHLKKTYSSHIAVEMMHISDAKARKWLEERMEPDGNQTSFRAEQRQRFLIDLIEATQFEIFLQKNFTGQKRFSLEGGESMLPAIKHIVRLSAEEGSREIVFGMAHRGRINVLANVLKKPFKEIFREFEGYGFDEQEEGGGENIGFSGDVKYHLGFSRDVVKVHEKKLHMAMAFNPSHLESVGPVIQGIARAKQDHLYGGDKNAVIPLLVHGDAAVVGQGVVMETLNLSQLSGYRTGGTIHMVVNNQIGFTTFPEEGRSTQYCTSFAKAVEAPIFHVNAFDVESVIHVAGLAIQFRMKFHRDVFIDLYCYRKYGHNEGDEPRFTQPLMYERISKHPSLSDVYSQFLIDQGIIKKEKVEEIGKDYSLTLSKSLKEVREIQKEIKNKEVSDSQKAIDHPGVDHQGRKLMNKNKTQMIFKNHWSKIEAIETADSLVSYFDTSIKEKDFEKLLEVIHFIPPHFKVLNKFKRLLEGRLRRIKEGNTIDWAVSEQMAFGSLLLEGYNVRLSGQDSIRGTFSHRHLMVVDQQTGEKYNALEKFISSLNVKSHISLPESSNSNAYQKVFFSAYNSPLSEYAVMAFDFGYSSVFPYTLTIWEAQFGDFANGAQIVIDQFIAGSEEKWGRINSLVLLLPHGYEGQGPEHSSARLERFLQLAGQLNIIVAYPTMPSQFCHLLRRQMLSSFRKPLIVMTPKSPLRMPEVVSKKDDFLKGGFRTILISGANRKKAKKMIFCTGKIYWDLQKELSEKYKKQSDEIVFIRLEQLYPLDEKSVLRLKEKYTNVSSFLWVQEEPENMGAWNYIQSRFLKLGFLLKYVGRKSSAGVATGIPSKHKEELNDFLTQAFLD